MNQSASAIFRNSPTALSRMGCTDVMLSRSSSTLPVKAKASPSYPGVSLLKKDRVSFERFLAEHEIAFHGDPDELDMDWSNLEQAL